MEIQLMLSVSYLVFFFLSHINKSEKKGKGLLRYSLYNIFSFHVTYTAFIQDPRCFYCANIILLLTIAGYQKMFNKKCLYQEEEEEEKSSIRRTVWYF